MKTLVKGVKTSKTCNIKHENKHKNINDWKDIIWTPQIAKHKRKNEDNTTTTIHNWKWMIRSKTKKQVHIKDVDNVVVKDHWKGRKTYDGTT